MASNASLARPYAQAWFDCAQAAGEDFLTAYAELLEFLAAWSQLPEIAAMVANPTLAADHVLQLFSDALEHFFARQKESSKATAKLDVLASQAQALVKLLAYYKRFHVMPEIDRLFRQKLSHYLQQCQVEVISAQPLTDQTKQRLADTLHAYFGQKIQTQFENRPEIVGGLQVQNRSQVIDASLATQLEELRRQLLADY